MPRLPEYPENYEPPSERQEVLDILANPFEPMENVLVNVTLPAEIVRYYKDGFYQVKLPDGLFDDELVLYHHSDISKDPDGDRRNSR